MWAEHRDQFLAWLKTFTSDPVVADLVEKVDKERSQLTQATHKTPSFDDSEEIVPASADSGGGEGEEM